jgi:hypothetical protein
MVSSVNGEPPFVLATGIWQTAATSGWQINPDCRYSEK